MLLQEIKCVDEAFPAMEIEELGYNIATHGQKTYNGVAILSRFPLEDITKGLPGNEEDPQARYIESVVSIPQEGLGTRHSGLEKDLHSTNPQSPKPNAYTSMRVASVYVPNGQTTDSEKFPYKLKFLNHLHAHLQTLLGYNEMLVVGGDYNIAPEDIDVHDPAVWRGSVLTCDEVRKQFRRLRNLGLQDAYRFSNPSLQEFSWWDYRAGGFARNNGLRIDHLLLSSLAADKLKNCVIEREMRAVERASDHTPVIGEFSSAA